MALFETGRQDELLNLRACANPCNDLDCAGRRLAKHGDVMSGRILANGPANDPDASGAETGDRAPGGGDKLRLTEIPPVEDVHGTNRVGRAMGPVENGVPPDRKPRVGPRQTKRSRMN